ncbi:hypothetical protein M758_1G247800 [Ceratodon purpureus]|nr:hypothetical protein M758_1G247800 [Ceratodon purpureus]
MSLPPCIVGLFTLGQRETSEALSNFGFGSWSSAMYRLVDYNYSLVLVCVSARYLSSPGTQTQKLKASKLAFSQM